MLPGELGPPPAPSLTQLPSIIIQTSNDNNNAGGACNLWYATEEEGPYVPAGIVAWDVEVGWPDYVEGWYRATEWGNGHTYKGQSDPCDPIYVS